MFTNTVFGCNGCDKRHRALQKIQEVISLEFGINKNKTIEEIRYILDEAETEINNEDDGFFDSSLFK